MLLNGLLVAVALCVVGTLLLPRIWNAPGWRATVTPLASIIGSGFLVVAPLLGYSVGIWAPAGMLGIVILAYAIGAVIRFNIRHFEPLLGTNDAAVARLERLAHGSLGIAYVISVAFYIRLLASFLLHPFGTGATDWLERAITTFTLASIGAVGVAKGLNGLEWLEKSAVAVKLGIISALLVGLLRSDLGWLGDDVAIQVHAIPDTTHALRLLAGMLLVVQGFETSRYLGAAYSAELRIRTMRNAQWITGGIYIAFVCLALPMLGPYGHPPSDTAIIETSQKLATILPPMMILAALMSQLSAAVADTAGAGGLFTEASAGRISLRAGYVAVVSTAVLLIWLVDVFGIVAIASRAFAFYYLIQCLEAWLAARTVGKRSRRILLRCGFILLATGLAGVVVFAVPVDSG